MALLKELEIPAEAVLVNSTGGDGSDRRLPTPTVFDHVLVRATVSGKAYWLDGTRFGERQLRGLPAPTALWGLPLRAGSADLEPIARDVPILPQMEVVLDVDASRGTSERAKVREQYVLRGPEVQAIRTQLAAATADDAQRAVRAFVHGQDPWLDATSGAWRYDESEGVLIMDVAGETRSDWEGDDKEGRTLSLWNAGFSPPVEFRRPAEQDQTAPWLTNFPRYRRWTTTMRLPPPAPGHRWALQSAPVARRLAGVSYWRQSELTSDVLRITMSTRNYVPEITAAEAQQANAALPAFDNKMSQVYETAAASAASGPPAAPARGTEALVQAAARATAARRPDEAKRDIDQALALDAKYAPALRARFNLFVTQSDYPHALTALDALGVVDTRADLRAKRAWLLYQTGHKEEGLKVFDEIASSPPADPFEAFDAAKNAEAAGAQKQAEAIVDQGIKASPESIDLLQLRTFYEKRSGHSKEALADIDAAIRIQPESLGNFENRALVLRALGRDEEALAAAEEAVRMDPLSAQARQLQIAMLNRMGRKADVAGVYEDWIARDRSGLALNSRCWYRALDNIDLQGAEADCATSVKMQPNEAGIWDSYGLVAFRSGRFDEAIKRYDHALALNPKLADSLYARGLSELRRGDQADGQKDIAAAKELAPGVGKELTEAGITP